MPERGCKILVSAGEASGDRYAAALVSKLRERLRNEGRPAPDFFGCTGPEMRRCGVRTIIDASSLAVVGLLEVVGHLPRIYKQFRTMVSAAETEKPDLAILTDSPDFHLRLAKKLKRSGVPVVYLVAPQVWAWRKGRIPLLRRTVDRLLCIFPFEEPFFARHQIPATYIGHPLSRLVRPTLSRADFLSKHGLATDRPVIALLPGSRGGEARRHMPALLEAVERIRVVHEANFILGVPAGRFTGASLHGFTTFRERIEASAIQVIEGETWDLLAHADLALAASGTVTIEAALLGTPMVTFYKVTGMSWWLGRFLVRVPFYSMVNLVAERAAVPELMQNEMRGEQLAAEALRLLSDPAARDQMRRELETVAARLSTATDPMDLASGIVDDFLAGVCR